MQESVSLPQVCISSRSFCSPFPVRTTTNSHIFFSATSFIDKFWISAPSPVGWALISVSCKRMTRTALFLAVSYKWEPGPCKKHCSALIGCQDLEGIPWCLPQSDQQWFYLPTWHTASGLNGQVSVLFSLTEISRKRLLEVYCSFISVCVFVVHFCVHLFSSTQKNSWVIGYAINFLWNTVIGEKTFHSTLCTSVKN